MLKNLFDRDGARFSKLELRNGAVLKNRVLVPPMASATADERGFVTEKTIDHYERLSESGAGVVLVEYTYVDVSGKSEPNQLSIESEDHLSGLARLAKAIQAQGAVAGIQITHAGGKTDRSLTGGVLMGPSAVSVPVANRVLATPDAVSLSELANWQDWFAVAAERAVRAGFDLIEIHSAHGYGLNQWLSPLTNQRTDLFGGSIQNRSRILFEIVEEIRAKHPSVLISIRLPGADFLPGGLSSEDIRFVAVGLEARGVDLLNVSSGIGGWRRPDTRTGEGYLVPEARAIQSVVSLPVIGVGGIQSGEFIDQALREHSFTLAAVGRAILNDPRGWRAKVMDLDSSKERSHEETISKRSQVSSKEDLRWYDANGEE